MNDRMVCTVLIVWRIYSDDDWLGSIIKSQLVVCRYRKDPVQIESSVFNDLSPICRAPKRSLVDVMSAG